MGSADRTKGQCGGFDAERVFGKADGGCAVLFEQAFFVGGHSPFGADEGDDIVAELEARDRRGGPSAAAEEDMDARIFGVKRLECGGEGFGAAEDRQERSAALFGGGDAAFAAAVG